MTKPIQIFQVDAFANRPFSGNPAAVCLLDAPRDAGWMQSVAAEMNLSETAFVSPAGDAFALRWFTPRVEVDLCGHATLAAAHTLWTENVMPPSRAISFDTRSGRLTATRRGGHIELDFPSTPPVEDCPSDALVAALGVSPSFLGKSKFDTFVVVTSESALRSIRPDFPALASLPARGVIVTSLSEDPRFDFVSRYFAPAAGIDEDPVTGSAHCCLAPFWAERLNKRDLIGFQASSRGGVVHARVENDRVILGGAAVTILRGELTERV